MKHDFAFDAEYYARYYRNAKTRVTEADETTRLARFLASYTRFIKQPVRNVLDLGCGLGQLKKPLAREFPRARYVGVERSAYACERYGLEPGSVVDFKSRTRFDLVICKGVLQYLTAAEADAALKNLATLCRGCLYLEALTREDWANACDQQRSDGAVYLRPAQFYRRRLRVAFTAGGAGIFIHERSGAVLYALETL
jgi:2-polyprenyl-3-methyl-5-hydroxy-6-metoxy-1,4-benzoquinol methylase